MSTTQELWEIYHRQLLGFISSRVSDKEVAKDILHEVFIKIHTKLPSVKDTQRLRGWIYQVTKNSIIDYYRAKGKNIDIQNWADVPFEQSNSEVKEELSLCLGYLIQKLPDKYKRAIQLSEVEGKTQEELAQYEKITLSGAKSRVQRGRKMLKQMILECCEIELNEHERIVDYSVKDKPSCELVKNKTLEGN